MYVHKLFVKEIVNQNIEPLEHYEEIAGKILSKRTMSNLDPDLYDAVLSSIMMADATYKSQGQKCSIHGYRKFCANLAIKDYFRTNKRKSRQIDRFFIEKKGSGEEKYREMIKHLPQDEQEILTQRVLYKKGFRTIAKEMGLPTKEVKEVYKLLIEELRDDLDDRNQ